MNTNETYTDISHTLNNIIDHMAPERIIKTYHDLLLEILGWHVALINSSWMLNKLHKNAQK